MTILKMTRDVEAPGSPSRTSASPSGFEIRPCTAPTQGLFDCITRAYRGQPDEDGDEALSLRKYFDGEYGAPLSTCSFAAYNEGVEIGASVLSAKPYGALVAFVFVDPTHWGQGLGAHLLARSLEVLPGVTCGDTVELFVHADATQARAIYESLEFSYV